MKRRQAGRKCKALPSGSNSKNVCQAEPIKEPQTETSQWGLLIPELLEMVIENLDFEEDRSSILNMRGVHPHWNQVVNSVLERRRLPALREWAPFHELWKMEDVYRRKYWPLFIPKMEVAPFNQRLGGIGTVEGAGVTKSIYLFPKGEESTPRVKRAKRGQASSSPALVSASSIFSLNLTSVVLYGIQYSPKQLQKLLNEVPQLKTLEIFKTTVMLKHCQDFEKKWPLPPLQKLKTLIVRGNGVDNQKPGGKYLISRWLTKPYVSGQLTHLEVDNAKFVDPWKIEKLQQLKIYGLASLPVEQSVASSTSLIRLSILDVERNQVAFKDFVGFLKQFSKKLEHLHLDVKMDDFKDVWWEQEQATPFRRYGKSVIPKLPELILENQVVFPQLKTFTLPLGEVESYFTAVEYLMQQFPTLDELQLISTGKAGVYYYVKLREESKRIWKMCSNLKAIQLYKTREENSYWRSVERGKIVTTSKFYYKYK